VKVRVLGSAAGGGLPQWNCGCANCTRARAADPDVPPRSQPSLALSADGVRWSLANASPDVRDQLARAPGLHPRPGTRDVPLDTVVVTNADIDHVLGLLVLREALPYRIVTTAWIQGALLDHNAAFRLLAPAFHAVKLDEPFFLDRGEQLEARLFPLPGKVPTWLAAVASNAPEATLGLRVTDRRGGRRLVYAPGVRALDSGTWAELAAADLRFVDGTFWSGDELRRLRPGAPDAVAMGHLPIGGRDGSLARLSTLPGRTLYTHVNNTNPVLDARSSEAAEVRALGVEIAMDGQELEL
jgi:pyrroloquinoline quinone biosynthesis protein B